MRPIDAVRRACPKARASYLAAIENGDALFKAAGITTSRRLAHFLAQICHESGGLTIEWESGAYSADRLMQIFGEGHHSAAIRPDEAQRLAHNGPAIFERVYGLGNPKKARELGNTQSGDGFKFRGGGLMQTTGRGNYRRMGLKCGVDFEANPDMVLSAANALKPALAEWTEGHLNDAADLDDILGITKKINGGTNGLDERRAWLTKFKAMITSVELDAGSPSMPPAANIPAPAPRPTPLPIPAPKPPAVQPKHAGIGALILAVLAGIVAFVKAHPLALLAAIIAAGAGGYFLWKHFKKDN